MANKHSGHANATKTERVNTFATSHYHHFAPFHLCSTREDNASQLEIPDSSPDSPTAQVILPVRNMHTRYGDQSTRVNTRSMKIENNSQQSLGTS